MDVELNDAVNPQEFQQFLLGAMQQYQAAQQEILELEAGYDVPMEEADIPPMEAERLEQLEVRSSVIEDTIDYWHRDAKRGYNLLT